MFRNGANQEFLEALDFLNRGSQVRVLLGAQNKTSKKPNKYRVILKEISVVVLYALVANLRQNHAFLVSPDRPLIICQFLEICSLYVMIHAYHLRNKSKTWRGIQVALVRQINRRGVR